nr:histidine kinase [Allomuricauda oceani]
MGLTTFLYYRSNKQQKLANNLLALKSLRTQMNPHFIFNALNSVNNYIAKSDERSANRFLSEFSVLMRSVLENSEEDFIPLTKELELLELYIKLEHSRFSDKFDYEMDVDKKIDVDAFQIPPMLLQPYIENAIWHGLRYKEEKGFLKIKVRQITEDMLEICIEDDGIGRKKSGELKTTNQKKQKSKGMGNIKKRIQILNDMYKNRVDVSIADLNKDQTGTRVSLKLKKQ